LRGLSDEQHVSILRKVQGGMSWKSAGDLAFRVKTMASIKLRVMTEIQARDDSLPDVSLDNWSVYVRKFPLACHAEWLGKWLDGLSREKYSEKQPFPNPMNRLWYERYQIDLKGNQEVKQVIVFV